MIAGMGVAAVIFALLPATLAPPASACAPDLADKIAGTDAEATIRQAETDWAASIGKDEAAFLRRSTAPNFVAVFDGDVIDRATLIAGARKRREGSASDVLGTLRVHLFGAAAVAEGDEIWTEAGSPGARRIVWSDMWVHCGGEWRLVTSTASTTPER